jgi:GTP cyclohydrolase I
MDDQIRPELARYVGNGPNTEHIVFTTVEEVAEFLLQAVAGLNSSDPQEEKTPTRFVQALKEMTTPEQFEFTVFESEDHDMVTEFGIPFVSLCRHHVLPFTGVAHVAYVPNKRMAGLSKLARTVQSVARSLQTQEQLTAQIANYLELKLEPKGVGVVMEAEHMCMALRGVRASGIKTRTATMRGVFADHTRTAKAEFMSGIDRRG